MGRASIALVVVLGAWIVPAGAARAQADCAAAPNQMEASLCARANWEESDAVLNRLWGRVKPAADRAGRGDALLQAQRRWLKARDRTCEAERAQYEGGSIAPQIYWSCMDRLTRQRNAELRRF